MKGRPIDVPSAARRRRIVVVGGGGSGIPLAARLGQAGHEVVLLEAGPAGAADAATASALRDAWTVRAGMPDGELVYTYDAELFAGRPWRIARGRVLGGSTAVNGTYFLRPHPADFAAWGPAMGEEWSYDACLPALRRLESDRDFGAAPWHGSSGPVPVERAGAEDAITQAFLHAAAARGAGVETDKNAGGPPGAGLLPRNARRGERWGVARAYAPLLAEASIHVRPDTSVLRIRFDGTTATGVEVESAGERSFIAADEVVLCAGAIETPRLLMASGIGDAAAGERHLVADLPGVGRALADHPALDIAWRPRPGAVSNDLHAAWTAAWNAPPGTVAASGIEYLLAAAPTAVILSGDRQATGDLHLRITLATPHSRGAVTGADTAVVRYDYLSPAADRAALRESVRVAALLLRSGELGAIVESADIPEWVEDASSDDIADDWLRANLGTALHSCGTARMGPVDDARAVVDTHGRVRGVERLRIADASVLPGVPSRGTALTAVMIGERMAELMAAE